MAGKIGNASSLAKLYLTYEQFEHLLKIISISKPQPSARSEKVKNFFQIFSQNLKIQFCLDPSEVKSQMSRSNSNYSLTSSQDLNESNSSLDLSIKEALNTLKTDTKKQVVSPSRLAISPRPVGRAYSNPSSPRSRNLRGFNSGVESKVRVSLLAPSQSTKTIPRNKLKLGGELDEFLETEKLVQREIFNVKVNLKPKETRRPQESRTNPRYFGEFAGNRMRPVEKPKPVKEDLKLALKDSKIAELSKKISLHREFLVKTTQKSFTQSFVMGTILRAWRLQIKKDKSEQAGPDYTNS